MSRAPSKIKPIIIKLLTEGKTPKEIAEHIGCNVGYVSSIRKKSGVDFIDMRINNKKESTLTEKQKETIILMHKEGYVDQKIADTIGISREIVCNFRLKNNLPRNGWMPPEKKKAIIDLCENMTCAQVASIVGEKECTVYATKVRLKKKP